VVDAHDWHLKNQNISNQRGLRRMFGGRGENVFPGPAVALDGPVLSLSVTRTYCVKTMQTGNQKKQTK